MKKERILIRATAEKTVIWIVFFSSRRRHTRYWRDWSSDVCSSDLDLRRPERGAQAADLLDHPLVHLVAGLDQRRERRGGYRGQLGGGRGVGERAIVGGKIGSASGRDRAKSSVVARCVQHHTRQRSD